MTTDWLTALQQFGRMRSMSAMETLQRQGEPQHSLFWLQEGTARAVYHSAQGQEKVKEFYFAGECCFLYLSWLTGSVADYSLQMLTPGRLCEIPLRLLDKPEHLTARLALLSQQVIYKEKKEQMFLLNNPEQRWQYVQANFPDWEQQLTQKDLASYIGISPVSLSRIRARLNKG
ncbi:MULTISPECIES: Crp/Fnr family transcriptional regulator [Phytobacter]|jgi:CRP-like cAMP-binding protein|uniref:Cyclic nucleotide-binding protein n=1 Tax=Phytobacter diazotrophicus TaxID=395631 RepID=A0ABN6LX67_9ENTR|nr:MULTISPECIES: Crp/Fnr family transcriptional regulator [Phytobacter]MDU4154939.1 Crp/Fnr family transcriptional regulator [Enterobacteriaceae bacterium]PXW52057.1 cyclic nucleotide-binding protein [Grimontella sp. AG753]SLK20283.1 cAMP-binding domain of CRP or a regulatory subunit of cAMP-dependent protein kinases [Enterobacter sp. NFR05]MDU4997353.1 Crp/Fnr family transcriptional regulator [Enterobacteriaceae bacterium]MDU7197750.1 Crp/Fnr family transcriptional regulator [Enterobacteriace